MQKGGNKVWWANLVNEDIYRQVYPESDICHENRKMVVKSLDTSKR